MDPNSVVGTPREYEVWLAPDWSDWDEKRSKGSGWTRVSVRETLYADGRRVTEVLDENRQPITHRTLSEEIDKDQEKRYKDAQAQAQRGDQEGDTRGPQNGPNREVYRGGKWVTEANPLYQGPSTSPTIGRVEGTPLPGGGYDNSKPIWVERDANGQQVGPAKPLTKDQREQWERDKNGGLTDAEVRERNSPENRVGKPTGNTRERVQNGQTVKETEYLLPDGTKEWRSQTAPAPTPDRVGKPTGNTRQRVENGQTIKETEYVLPDGTKEWRTDTAPAPARGGKLPPGVTPPRFTRGNVAAELNRFNRELDAAVSRGEISKDDAVGFYTSYHQEAQVFLQEQNYGDSQDQNAVNSALTQRSQNLTQAGNRASWANTAFQNAAAQDNNLLMGAAGTGRSALVPLLALQAGLANAAGGFRDAPEVEIRRFPAVGGDGSVPASIQPVINATTAAPSGTRPAPLLPPRPPVSAAEASANMARVQADAAAAVPASIRPSVPAPPPQATSMDASDPAQQGQAPVAPPVGTGAPGVTVQPVLSTPQNNLPPAIAIPPTGTLPMPPAAPVMPPAAGSEAGGNVQMAPLPPSIQAAMPAQQQGQDVDAVIERMLADGVPPAVAMEIRRRHKGATWNAA